MIFQQKHTRIKTTNWRQVGLCRQGVLTIVALLLVLQLLNTLTYVYLLDRSSNKAVNCHGYSHIYEEYTMVNETDSDGTSYFQLQVNRKTALIHGHFRQNKSYLTIGIPTIRRKGVNYLDQTLDSLIKNTMVTERKEIVVAVYLADQNQTWITDTANRLKLKYFEHIKSGFIQIFHFHEQTFPDFTHLPRTFNDSFERVAWRSKQNIDYAFMFMYCKNISHYYMQLEDDITASRGYFAGMKFFISNENLQKEWYSLEFSGLGFMGKLVRTSDLEELANFLLMFYWAQPADLLFGYLKQIKTQFKAIKRKPPLFQHKGVVSSLDGKRQFLLESSYKNSFYRKRFYNFNPPGDVITTIETFEDHAPAKAYDLSDDYFWGISPKDGDTFAVLFHKPENLTRIYFGFGLPNRQKDILENGLVKVSVDCKSWTLIGKVNSSEFDTNSTRMEIPINVKCVLLSVTKNQSSWVIIREISIFKEGDTIVENPYYLAKSKIKYDEEEMRKRMQINPIYAKQIQEQIEKIRHNEAQSNAKHVGRPLRYPKLPPDQLRNRMIRIKHDRKPQILPKFLPKI